MSKSVLHRRISVRALTVAFVLVALGAIAVFLLSNVLDAWMPNVATSALTVAATITIVNAIVRREESDRVRPRSDSSLARLGLIFADFAGMTLADYQDLGRESQVTTEDVGGAASDRWLSVAEKIIDEWLDVPWAEVVLPRETARFQAFFQAGLAFADEAKGIVDADREVLPPDLVAAIDELARDAAMARLLEEMCRAQGNIEPGQQQLILGQLVKGGKRVALHLLPYVDDDFVGKHIGGYA